MFSIRTMIIYLIIFIFPIYIDFGLYNFLDPTGFWQRIIYISIVVIMYIPMIIILYTIIGITINIYSNNHY